MNTAFWVTWLAASVRLAGPVLAAAEGELVCERAGVLNVGIEGTILLGALASFLTAQATGSLTLSLVAAIAAGVLVNLFLAWMYVTVRASQVVAGLVFNVLAVGAASAIYRLALGGETAQRTIPTFPPVAIPWLSSLPIIGPVFFAQTAPLYLTLLAAAGAHVFLFRTRTGLALRAAGENPRAADAAGISVERMRYLGVLVSGAMAGMAGAYMVLAQVGFFREGMVAGQGFIALGIVIFGRWSPWKAVGAALVFGACDALQFSLQLSSGSVPPQLLLALPYLVTILAISGIFGRAGKPAALMQPYSRD